MPLLLLLLLAAAGPRGAEGTGILLRRFHRLSAPDNVNEPVRIGVVALGSGAGVESGSRVSERAKTLGDTVDEIIRQLLEAGDFVVGGVVREIEVFEIVLSPDPDLIDESLKLLEDERIRFIIGPCGNAETLAAAVSKRGGMVLIAPLESRTSVFKNRPMVFGVARPVGQTFDASVAVLSKAAGKTAAYIMYDDGDPNSILKAQCKGFEDSMKKAGVEIKAVVTVKRDMSKDWGYLSRPLEKLGIMQTLLKAQPSFMGICLPHDLCGNFVGEASLNEFDPDAFVFSTMCAAKFATAKEQGVLRWSIFIEDFSIFNDTTSVTKDQTDPMVTVSSWVATQALLKVISTVGSIEALPVAAGLRALDWQNPYGRLSFDANGQNKDTKKVYQWQSSSETPVLLDSADKLKIVKGFVPIRYCYETGDSPWDWQAVDSPWGFENQGSCVNCPEKGLGISAYDTSTQRRVCEPCAEGLTARSYDGGDHGKCILCPFGSILNEETRACEECPKGSYGSQKETCTLCTQGTFSGQTASQSCQLCAAGTINTAPGQSECTACKPGTSAYSPGSVKCHKCQVGLFASDPGSKQCLLCPAGKVANTTNTAFCHECQPGKHSSREAQACIDCEAGRSQAHAGRTNCEKNTAGTIANDGITGLVYPMNEKHHWFDVKTQQAVFCSFSRGCMEQQRCDEGHFGMGCTSCLPASKGQPEAFVRSIGGCNQCLHEVANWVILALLLVGAVVFFVGCTRFVARSSSLGALYVIYFKQLLIFLISSAQLALVMRELLLEVFEKATGTVLFDVLSELIQMMRSLDGTIPTDTRLWSVSCFVQSVVPDETRIAMQQALHHQYYDEALLPHRKILADAQITAAAWYIATWICVPIIIIVGAHLLGLFFLQWDLYSNSSPYKDAVAFYRLVYWKSFLRIKTSTPAEKWKMYVDVYDKKVLHIWSPIMHAASYSSRKWVKTCNLRHFLHESQPITVLVYFIMCPHVARNILRFGQCVKPDTVTRRHVYAPEIPCGVRESVGTASFVLGVSWLVLPPLFMLSRLFRIRSKSKDEAVQRSWGLLLDGYKLNKWWWEIVSFARKASLLIIPAFGITVASKVDLGMLSVMFFAVLHLCFQPYEDRRNDILSRTEWYMFTVLFMDFVLLKFAASSQNMAVMTIAVIVIFVCYVAMIAFFCGLILRSYWRVTAVWVHSTKDLDKKHTLMGRFYRWVGAWEAREKRSAPYVAFDHYYGWLSIFGSRGDLATSPYVAKGLDAVELQDQRATLSECAEVSPDESIEPADFVTRMHVNTTLSNAMKHVVACLGSKANLSVSLYEFVIRAAFLLHRKHLPKWLQESLEEAEDVDKTVLAKAYKTNDPLKLQDAPEGQAKDEEGDEYIIKALDVEQDLRKVSWKLIRDKLAGDSAPSEGPGAGFSMRSLNVSSMASIMNQALDVTKNLANDMGNITLQGLTGGEDGDSQEGSASSSSSSEGSGQGPGLARSASQVTNRNPEDLLKELDAKRFRNMVHDMFKPGLFNQGLALLDFQGAMLRLTHLTKDEIRKWVDAFEQAWRGQRVDMDHELSKQVGRYRDSSCNTQEEEFMELAAPSRQSPAVGKWMILVLKTACGLCSPQADAVTGCLNSLTKKEELQDEEGEGTEKAKAEKAQAAAEAAAAEEQHAFQIFKGFAEMVKIKDLQEVSQVRAQHNRDQLQAKLDLRNEWIHDEEQKCAAIAEEMAALRGETAKRLEAMAESPRHAGEHARGH